MSVLTGGIFSRPRGKTGGIVFGAARTRQGKLVTSRLLVPPSNPNTAAQQTQRSKFSEALAITRLLGPGIYQSDWNRAIGQLPGFNSLFSTYLNSLDSISDIGVIPPVNLGSLHLPDTITVVSGGGSGEIAITLSQELGINGTDADTTVFLAVATSKGASPLTRIVVVMTGDRRDDVSYLITGLGSGTPTSVLTYLRGAGTAAGLVTPTGFAQANAGV